jgi:diguanylate cyclase
MDESTAYEKFYAIHDQTLHTLRALNLPPLPEYYQKHFDEIFAREADGSLRQSREKSEASFHSYPDLTRYLDIAQHSIDAFIETHADITHVAQLQENYIQKASNEGVDRCIHFVEGLSELGHNMSAELKKAQNKIDELSHELNETITQLTLDPLTKVTNRKGLMEDLSHMIEAGRDQSLPIVLLMIDADDFKGINDRYGHIAGDKVLYFFAQSIKSVIRKGDRVYRFGGEEFSVILDRCDHEEAFALADKIRSKIEQSHLIYSGQTIKLTVSVGATIHHANDTYDDFLTRADTALYQAKHGGKNKTVFID